jgi:hypothetical protein
MHIVLLGLARLRPAGFLDKLDVCAAVTANQFGVMRSAAGNFVSKVGPAPPAREGIFLEAARRPETGDLLEEGIHPL